MADTGVSRGDQAERSELEDLSRRLEALERRVEILSANAVPRELLDRELARVDHQLSELREVEEP